MKGQKPEISGILGGLAFGLVGLAILMLGASLLINSNRLAREGRETAGTLVDYVKRESRNGPYRDSQGKEYSSRGFLVRFTTEEGKTIEFLSRYQKSSDEAMFHDPIYDVGDKAPVLYMPADPSNAELKTPFLLWVDGTFAVVFGVIFILGGLGVYHFFGKSRFP